MLLASFLGLFLGLALLVVLTMLGNYMEGITGFFISWFPPILLGAIFGQLMDDSGAARTIARKSRDWCGEKRAIAAVVGSGGRGVFVMEPWMTPEDPSRSSQECQRRES